MTLFAVVADYGLNGSTVAPRVFRTIAEARDYMKADPDHLTRSPHGTGYTGYGGYDIVEVTLED